MYIDTPPISSSTELKLPAVGGHTLCWPCLSLTNLDIGDIGKICTAVLTEVQI